MALNIAPERRGHMDGLSFEIGHFLAEKAYARTRTTYQQVAEAVGWPHPAGRGLGGHLEALLYYCKDRGWPPLTTIVVEKGTKHPAPDAMKYITSALGNIDIDKAQQDVFAFAWSSAPEFVRKKPPTPLGLDVWLTSFWGFEPATWGCVGFTRESARNRFLRISPNGALVVIYVTKAKGPEEMRGKVVGILKVSNRVGHAEDFLSGDAWAWKEDEPDSRGKWNYAIEVTQAWRIAEEEQKPIEEFFPAAYSSADPQFIGAQGVIVGADEAMKLLGLTVYEVPVYGQKGRIDSAIQPFENVLTPSKAIHPAKEPYWVGETDGPKHLYILRLAGDIAAYLGKPKPDVDGCCIVKVGFSKSPISRRDQIQSAYPDGKFKWEVFFPKEIPVDPPYPNAEIAIAGEDAMKARMIDEHATSLGGEFFLAHESVVYSTWQAGKLAATNKMKVAYPLS